MKKQRGFTLIELLIAISILGIIMLVISSVFKISLLNYRENYQKSFFQKRINFATDNIIKDVKLSTSVPTEYDPPVHTLSNTKLILALPAVDEADNFVYVGNTPERDYFIYFLEGNELKRKTFTSPLGKRAGINEEEQTLLTNVTSLEFTYLPGLTAADQVKVKITLGSQVNGRTISVSGERTANLRNKQ